MDPTELAFAGIARQAELIRDREVSSRELTELYLDRIERLDPELNAFTGCSPSAPSTRRPTGARWCGHEAPLLGVPIAVKDVEDVAGVVTRFGTAAFDEAGDRRLGDGRSPAGGRRGDRRQDEPARARDLRLHRVGDAGASPATPGAPAARRAAPAAAAAAAVAAGLVGAARRRPTGPARSASRRRSVACSGLKPQRGRLPFRPADHWWGMSVTGAVTRTVLDTALCLDLTIIRERRAWRAAAARAPLRRGGGDGAGQAADRALGQAGADDRCRRSSPTRCAAGVETEASCCARSGTRSERPGPRLRLAANNLVARYLRGIRDDVEAVPHPERLESRTRGFGRLGAAYPRRSSAAPPGGRA